MAENSSDANSRYFSELALRLKAAGFGLQPSDEDGRMAVAWKGQPLCLVNGAGNILYRSEDMRLPEIEAAKDQVVSIARSTAEYMQLMEAAPQLKASGLSGDYRMLADFGGAVLAGHPTQYGVEFITWDWDFNRKGVSHGHYFEHGTFAAAKQDFAVRAGLVPGKALFTPEQLSDLAFCIKTTQWLSDELTGEKSQRLGKLGEQINGLIPREVSLKPQQEQGHGMEMGGMT